MSLVICNIIYHRQKLHLHPTQLSSLTPDIWTLEDLMTFAALSCVTPPVSEPTVECQSGSALLSIRLKRHHYNQEPV